MTTAEAIAGITDAGQFEILATRALRALDSDCHLLEHLGVNSAGKTRKNPVDGFVEVPGMTPRRFVMTQFATTAVDTLEDKWLFDHVAANDRARQKNKPENWTEADDGDLLKADRIASKIRATEPRGTFVVWLCSNQALDVDLQVKVRSEGLTRSLEVKFLGQTTLRDFLDTKPEGQWLRKEHLGILATQLSHDLLKEISSEVVKSYGAEIAAVYQTTFASTQGSVALNEIVSRGDKQLVFIVGSSGSGKSVLAYQWLQSVLESGGFALWISEQVVANSTTLSEAIEKTLLAAKPGLEPGCARVALALAQTHAFAIVVDDVNRAADPSRLVSRLAAWAKPPAQSSSTSQADPAKSIGVVCPLWDSVWTATSKRLKDSNWIGEYESGRMSEQDAVICLRTTLGSLGATQGNHQLSEIAADLAFDPILLAIFAANALANGALLLGGTASSSVIADYESTCFDSLAAQGRGVKSEFKTAVNQVAEIMLRSRNFYPSWDELATEMASDARHLAALNVLVHDSRICRLVTRGDRTQFEFRHDRILEFQLVRTLAAALTSSIDSDFLSEPYYARLIGKAIVAGEVPKERVNVVCASTPAAIFAALSSAKGDSTAESDFSSRAKAWMVRDDGFFAATPALQEQIVGFLENTDSKSVLDVISPDRDLRFFARARFRNGALDAALYSVGADSEMFYPSSQYARLESDVDHVLRRHGDSLLSALKDFLEQRVELGAISAALTLAGYFARPELQPAITTAVERHSDPDLLLPALWSVMRCAGPGYDVTLPKLLEQWFQLPDPGPRGHTITKRMQMTQNVRFFIRKGLSEEMVRFLVKNGRSSRIGDEVMASALSEVDHPDAVAFAVEQGIASDEWNLAMPRSRSLSTRSRRALKEMSDDTSRDTEIRERAFRVWVRSASDVTELRAVDPKRDEHGLALWRRCVLGDHSATSELARRIAGDTFWLRVAHHVWSPTLVAPVDSLLEKLARDIKAGNSKDFDNTHYELSELLRDIPANDAEPLLLKHWDGLSSAPNFVQTALYIGSPKLLELADAAIRTRSDQGHALTHIGATFGFIIAGLSDRITIRHIRVLADRRAMLPDSDLNHIASSCFYKKDMCEFVPVFQEEIERRAAMSSQDSPAGKSRARLFPTEAELFGEFGPASQIQFFGWLDQLSDRIGSKKKVWSALLSWTMNDLPQRFAVFADAIATSADRSELSWLERIPVSQLDERQRRNRENAFFAVKMRSLV